MTIRPRFAASCVMVGLFTLLCGSTAEAVLFVGTLPDGGQLVGNEDDNDDLGATAVPASDGTGVIGLIDFYNETFNASLSFPATRLGRILNDGPGTEFEGSLNLGDFTFYEQDTSESGGDLTVMIGTFDVAIIEIANIDLVFDKKFVAFKYEGPSVLKYYTAKAAQKYSLWSYLGDGVINPVYYDADADLDTVLDEGAFLTGMGTGNALSHIGIYGSAVVPEPASITLFGMGMLGILGFAHRRKRKSSDDLAA